MKTTQKTILILAAFLSLGSTLAAPLELTLGKSLELAAAQGADLQSARSNLRQAESNLRQQQADPSSPIDVLTKVQNAYQLEGVRLAFKKLELMNSVLQNYLGLLELQENIPVLQAQTALDQRNLEIAKAKNELKVATPLDVSKAQSTLRNSAQKLRDTQAQLPIQSNRLETVLGLGSESNPTAGEAPKIAEKKLDLNVLQKGLEQRLPSVLEAQNALEEASLAVKIFDNDYTPAATLRDAKLAADNAQRGLEAVRRNAVTSLKDAFRAAQDALEQMKLKTETLDNSKDQLELDRAKFKAGTLSGVQLKGSELQFSADTVALLTAKDAYLKALSSLSVAAGSDVTGLLK